MNPKNIFNHQIILLLLLIHANYKLHHAFQLNQNKRSFCKARTQIRQGYSKTETTKNLYSQSSNNNDLNKELNIAIVGGGPSGLLAAHGILSSPILKNTKLTILESRSDPRRADKATLKGRAYALGIGIRGRTAIKSINEVLWNAIKQVGYECERFDLHFGTKFKLRLRDDSQRSSNDGLEPSVLIYQTDLCSAMINALDDKVRINFDSMAQHINIKNQTIQLSNTTLLGPFDLIVGCDGVNSMVRKSMQQINSFESSTYPLRGKFKVVRLSSMPPLLDPTSIHAIPSSDGSSAFVEPTKDGEACILFATSSDNDALFSNTTSLEDIASTILNRFPLLQGMNVQSAAEQIISQQSSSTYAVQCNSYHYKSSIALVGDAAHATGGVSGQGVNSALQDSVALVRSLEHAKTKQDLSSALLSYSQSQVPEGMALFDLSFGPKGLDSKNVTKKQVLLYTLKNMIDTIFGGRFGIGQPTLQTIMTTTLTSFSEIRRGRDDFYSEKFLSGSEWNDTLALLHEKQLQD